MGLRVVFDTNIIVSRMLLRDSTPARAVSTVLSNGVLLTSTAALEELADVLARKKFDRYVSISDRKEFFRLYCRVAERIEVVRRIAACRDPRDDKYLEVAINGAADYIVTGDADLLTLNPFEKIRIMTPVDLIAEIDDSAGS